MGKFIVIEGTDCSGKETQSKLLVEKLESLGYKAIRLTFPNYDTPTGKIVGGPYLGKKEICECWFPEGAVNLDPKVACLYYAADRKYNEVEIKKYLDDDYFVICDRYVSSNMAHQGSKIKNDEERFHMYEWIDKLEFWLLGLPKPDKTIFLHVPYTYAARLKKNRVSLDEHEMCEEHLKNSEIAYVELSELYNWKHINCINDDNIRSVEDINEEIVECIKEYL
ncbi:MAG: dTMP kinase [Bacilli bacterium]|nr:dTMP kinase [Bacilli bacterium]